MKNAMKMICKIGSYILFGALILILLINVYLLFAKHVLRKTVPTIFGYTTAVIQSNSMYPTLKIGDYIVIKKQSVENYQVGDIITFFDKTDASYTVTHRIIERTENGVITQGDNNNTADSEISYEAIVGKVMVCIPFIGTILSWLQSPLGICVMILGGYLLFRSTAKMKAKTE